MRVYYGSYHHHMMRHRSSLSGWEEHPRVWHRTSKASSVLNVIGGDRR